MPDLLHITMEQSVFSFFFFAFSGWVGETIMESLVRGRLVNKGVFTGPWVPVHGLGAFVVYGLLSPFKAYPPAVFAVGAALCTLVEYLAALFLENVFHVRGWDYDEYPFTQSCNYKRRVALTTSLFFGLVAAGVVYFYWDVSLWITSVIGQALLIKIDAVLAFVFTLDVAFTARKYIRNYRAGIPNKTVGLE
ncbi:MAG: putative ABC transporter permease [Spirochaetaceae bacterium]|jgi:uncharacterized membrane protein|nr:putative ABC transporter permease [Spirochaetaceae bacterium]